VTNGNARSVNRGGRRDHGRGIPIRHHWDCFRIRIAEHGGGGSSDGDGVGQLVRGWALQQRRVRCGTHV